MTEDVRHPPSFPPKPHLILRVGIVGHRPRPDRPFATQAVHDTLKWFFDVAAQALGRARGRPYGKDEPAVLTLASSLAEGADQVAVRALKAIELPPGVTSRVEALLPFAREDFAETFETDEGRAGLKACLASADSTIELADWSPPKSPNADDERRRDQRYAVAGDLILRQSDVLVAVWDGQPARGRGGTAETVAIALRQGRPVVWVNPGNGSAQLLSGLPLYEDIFTSIAEHAVPLSDPKPLTQLIDALLRPPPPSAKEKPKGPPSGLNGFLEREAVPEICRWTTYEKWLVAPARRQLARSEASKGSSPAPKNEPRKRGLKVNYIHGALNDPAWKAIPALFDQAAKDRLIGCLGRPWAAADAIATKLGHVYRSIYLWVFGLGAFAVAFGLIGLFLSATFKLEWTEPLFSGFEFATLLVACILYWISHQRDHHTRWMNARALGEQIRAHWALTLLGAGGRRELDAEAQWSAWLFNAYAGEVGLFNLQLTPKYLLSAAKAMLDGVVLDQLQYHTNNQRRLALIHKRLENLGHVLLIFAILICAILSVWSASEFIGYMRELPPGEGLATLFHSNPNLGMKEGIAPMAFRFLAICAAILPTVGGALAAIRYQGDFERFSERSNKTAKELSRLEKELEKFVSQLESSGEATLQAPRYEVLLQIATDLERVLISDLDDWRFVYRSRPIFSPG